MKIGACICEVQRMSRFMKQSRIVALSAVWPEHEINFLRNASSRAKRARPLSRSLTDVVDDSSTGVGIESHLGDVTANGVLHCRTRKREIEFRRAKKRQCICARCFSRLEAEVHFQKARQRVIPHRLSVREKRRAFSRKLWKRNPCYLFERRVVTRRDLQRFDELLLAVNCLEPERRMLPLDESRSRA